MKALKINSLFYNQGALERTINDYRHLVKINFKKRGKYFFIEFKESSDDLIKIIADEFGNYLLAQVIKNR